MTWCIEWRRVAFLAVFCLVLLTPSTARSNPIFWVDPRLLSSIVMCGLVWIVIVVVEGAILKFILLGADGPSWPRAFFMTFVLNVASGIAGALSGIYFDIGNFEFLPSPFAVFGVSVGVESFVLGIAFIRRRLGLALLTAVGMNVASYLFLLLTRFPGGARI